MKPLLVGGILSTAGIAALAGVSSASAETGSTAMSDLASKIATKFNLDQDEVQGVFDDEREANKEAFEAKRSERLQALVDDGTITVEQKTAIELKITEMQTEREANKDSEEESDTDRKAEHEAKQAELEAWAEENNITLTDLGGILGGHGGGHRGGQHMQTEE